MTPADLKRISKGISSIPLEIHPGGLFVYKQTTIGRWEIRGGTLTLSPETVSGHSLVDMQAAAADANRTFNLEWLFDPIVLQVEDECLIADQKGSILVTEYRKR